MMTYDEFKSRDHFEKPELDICTIDGRKTNIVMGYVDGARTTENNPWAEIGVHSNGVVLDPVPPSPEERFRTIFSRSVYSDGIGVAHTSECAHSPDGIHWTPYETRPRFGRNLGRLGDVSCVHYDADAGQFVQNSRHPVLSRVALPPNTPWVSKWFGPHYPDRPDLLNKRRVYQTRSHDFLRWTEPVPVSVPDDQFANLDEAHYGMQQFRVGGMHFATLGVLRYVENEMDVRLVYSRDGLQFEPADRFQPFLAPRGEGYWDAHMVSMTSQPVEMGDEWWFYHGGTTSHHDWWITGARDGLDVPEAKDLSTVRYSLGLARLRKEGVASLDGSRQREGYVVTRPVMSHGTSLVVNARCRPGGSIRAAVFGFDNQPIGECSIESSDGFVGDSTAHTFTWNSSPELPGVGQWRKLAFFLRDSEIFSFRLDGED